MSPAMLAVPLIVVCAVVAIAWIQSARARKNLIGLAERLGCRVVETGRFITRRRIAGELRGRPFEIYSYTTGSGKQSQRWVAASITVTKSGGLTFSLKMRPTFLDALLRRFRKNEVATGDASFDKAWVLITNQPDFMRAALLPEIRQKIALLASGSSAGNFKYEIYALHYAERASFGSSQACNRLERVVPLLGELADVVEVGAEFSH